MSKYEGQFDNLENNLVFGLEGKYMGWYSGYQKNLLPNLVGAHTRSFEITKFILSS